ncbi:MAG TPA: phage holin, LLH family [Acidisarcina sp.]
MSFSSVFKGIGHGIKVVFAGAAHGFVALFGSDVAKQFAAASIALLKSAIGAIVTKVVGELATSDLSSNAKREEAVVQILAFAAQQGITVAESEVRMLIEIAVQFVKGKLTVTPA